MKVYATNDGEKFKAADHADFFKQLRASSWMETADEEEFMNQMAARATEQTGKVVHAGSVDQFVDGLIAVGLVVIKEGQEA